MTIIKKLEAARNEASKEADRAAGVMLTHDELSELIKAMRLSDAVWSIAKS